MVTADGREAAAAVQRGEAAVLIVSPPDAPAGGGAGAGGPVTGRLAVFVGDADDPATWESAREMERELFPDGPRTRR